MLVAAGLLFWLAGGVSAATITDFGPGDSFTANGVTITFERTETGTSGAPSNAYVTAGTAGATDLILVFSATATAGGAVDEIGVGAVFCDGPFDGNPLVCSGFPADFGRNSTGAGAGPAGNVEIDAITGTAGHADLPVRRQCRRLRRQRRLPRRRETSDEFWVSYASGDVLLDGDYYINFMISQSATDITQTVQLIPEPSTALLLGIGMGGLIIGGRKRR